MSTLGNDPWRARFAWFWYCSDEIWHFTQEQMDEKVSRYAAQGITHLITFSCTHFRWSFKPWWKEINACLAKIVRAAHTYGLKVIEHHSSCLTYVPEEGGYGKHREFFLQYLAKHTSSLDDWPGILEYNLDESKEEATWEQVDAVDGSKISTWYHGHIKCPNNPHYVAAYLAYLETVYATGIDGIMTDDMQFANQNVYAEGGERENLLRSCGCPYCREKFRKMYGYDLPAPDKWDQWFGSRDDSTFIDYIHFRHASTQAFHQAVKDHYESLGLKMLRPNYNSTPIQTNERGTWPGVFPQLDWLFQECQLSSLIKGSWLKNLVGQQMVAMYARRRGIPHKMMFYADRPDTLLFTFGEARLAGTMFTNTPEGNQEVDESAVRAFEQAFPELHFHGQCHANIAFLDSQDNRFYSAGYNENRMSFWMQACYLHNIPMTLTGISDESTWKAQILVANEIRLLSQEEIQRLKVYAANGGTLVLTGICGEQGDRASFRTPEQLKALWGLDFYDDSFADSYRILPFGSGRICLVGYNFGYPDTKEGNYKRFVFDPERRHRDHVAPRKECLPLGHPRFDQDGKALWELPSWYRTHLENASCFEQIASLLTVLSGDALTFRANLPELVLAVPYSVPEQAALTVQLLNAAGTLPVSREEKLSHAQPIPFLPWKGDDALLDIALPPGVAGTQALFTSVAQSSSAAPASIPLQATLANGRIRVTLPAGLLKDYGMIIIK